MDNEVDDDSCKPSTSTGATSSAACVMSKSGRTIKRPCSERREQCTSENESVAMLAYFGMTEDGADSAGSDEADVIDLVDEEESENSNSYTESRSSAIESGNDDDFQAAPKSDRSSSSDNNSTVSGVEVDSKCGKHLNADEDDGSSSANCRDGGRKGKRTYATMITLDRKLRRKHVIDYKAMADELNLYEGFDVERNKKTCKYDNDVGDDSNESEENQIDSDFDPGSNDDENTSSGHDESSDDDSNSSDEESTETNRKREHALKDHWPLLESAFQLTILKKPIHGSHLDELFQSTKLRKFPRRQHIKMGVDYMKYFYQRQRAMVNLKEAMESTKEIMASIDTARNVIQHHFQFGNVQTAKRNLQILCELSGIPSVEEGVDGNYLRRLQENWKQIDNEQSTTTEEPRCSCCKRKLTANDNADCYIFTDPTRPWYPNDHAAALCKGCQRKVRSEGKATNTPGPA